MRVRCPGQRRLSPTAATASPQHLDPLKHAGGQLQVCLWPHGGWQGKWWCGLFRQWRDILIWQRRLTCREGWGVWRRRRRGLQHISHCSATISSDTLLSCPKRTADLFMSLSVSQLRQAQAYSSVGGWSAGPVKSHNFEPGEWRHAPCRSLPLPPRVAGECQRPRLAQPPQYLQSPSERHKAASQCTQLSAGISTDSRWMPAACVQHPARAAVDNGLHSATCSRQAL